MAALGAACRTGAPLQEPVSPAPAPAATERPPVVQPGSPGQASTTVQPSSAPVKIRHVKADVAFMQGMIGHHAQALDMVALLETRTQNAGMKLLAQRIKVSQEDEIRFMQRWLESRGEAVPDEHAHHAHDFKPMPGMLSQADMAKLAAAQ